MTIFTDAELDVAVHPPLQHPLDPFTGKLVTRVFDASGCVEVVEADEHILLDCGFLWDIVANAAVFAPWVQLISPDRALDLESNFNVAPGFSLTMLPYLPTNKPVVGQSYPMCQHWTMLLTAGSRVLAYQIGSYRPSINAMEASWTT